VFSPETSRSGEGGVYLNGALKRRNVIDVVEAAVSQGSPPVQSPAYGLTYQSSERIQGREVVEKDMEV
jgi:hypothetical protein